MHLGLRLKEERERLGMSQPEFAAAADAKKHAQINWEKGVATPNGAAFQAWAEIGVDVLYVITGQRSTPDVAIDKAPLADRERLSIAIEAVTEGLAEASRKLPPRKLAELIMAAYDLIGDSAQSRENIIKLVRMVA